jgi:hypothetical protein
MKKKKEIELNGYKALKPNEIFIKPLEILENKSIYDEPIIETITLDRFRKPTKEEVIENLKKDKYKSIRIEIDRKIDKILEYDSNFNYTPLGFIEKNYICSLDENRNFLEVCGGLIPFSLMADFIKTKEINKQEYKQAVSGNILEGYFDFQLLISKNNELPNYEELTCLLKHGVMYSDTLETNGDIDKIQYTANLIYEALKPKSIIKNIKDSTEIVLDNYGELELDKALNSLEKRVFYYRDLQETKEELELEEQKRKTIQDLQDYANKKSK